MLEPDRRDPDLPAPEDRRRVVRAAFLRPLNVLTLVIGGVFFATTLAWWILPLTLLTYAALVFLAARDPFFRRQILGDGAGAIGGAASPATTAPQDADISPERRARWLPRGETRQKVETALDAYRKVVSAIEDSDEVARTVLDDVVPKLHAAANRLVDVAHRRENAAEAIRDLRDPAKGEPGEERSAALQELEDQMYAADAEISDALERLLTLRARVVRISIDSGAAARTAATELNTSLDELNLRLEALSETMSPPEDPLDRDL